MFIQTKLMSLNRRRQTNEQKNKNQHWDEGRAQINVFQQKAKRNVLPKHQSGEAIR
jgi:hypothetical protein